MKFCKSITNESIQPLDCTGIQSCMTGLINTFSKTFFAFHRVVLLLVLVVLLLQNYTNIDVHRMIHEMQPEIQESLPNINKVPS